MFLDKEFSSREWLIFLGVLLIPLVNIVFAIWLLLKIGIIPLLIKLVIAFGFYVVLTLVLLAIFGI